MSSSPFYWLRRIMSPCFFIGHDDPIKVLKAIPPAFRVLAMWRGSRHRAEGPEIQGAEATRRCDWSD